MNERERVVAAAKSFVPEPGPRQDRAGKHALWHVEAHERGEVAKPYPQALEPGLPALPVAADRSDYRVRDLKALAGGKGEL